MAVASRRLGRLPTPVSPLALGSWRTLERIGPAASAALLGAAAERGINFFDDARYDDESGTAPLPTGYSEVLFGEAFRAAGLSRDGTVVSNKLWWEHWPHEDAAAELDASLARMRFDHVDLIYAVTLPDGLEVEVAVAEVAGLLATGKARAWGVANWGAAELAEATAVAARLGIDPPAAVQLPYNLGDRAAVEDAAMEAALEASGAGLVPSNVLAGGVLTGKYGRPGDAAGRLGGSLAGLEPLLDLAARLERQAARLDTTAAALAIAFVLAHPGTVSALVGATSVAQIEANLEAIELLDRLTAADLAELLATLPSARRSEKI